MLSTVLDGTTQEMRKIPNGSVDLIITSPPYNMQNSSGNKWSRLKDGYANYNDNMPHDKYVEWQRECLTEMMRLIPNAGAVFYNHKWRIQGGLLQDRQDIVSGFPVRQIIIWKNSGGHNFVDNYFVPTYEVIYLIAKPKFKLIPGANGVGDVWHIIHETNSEHPCPFPVELPRRIIESTAAKVVLDPFLGSGSTAVAAKMLGRDYIGIELSQQYVAMAEERLIRTHRKPV